MMLAENGALDLLFGIEGEELLDVKCFRGDREGVTSDEIKTQIHEALMQLKMHPDLASVKAPDHGIKAVDMAVFAKDLVAA